jgi:hypothetical protein
VGRPAQQHLRCAHHVDFHCFFHAVGACARVGAIAWGVIEVRWVDREDHWTNRVRAPLAKTPGPRKQAMMRPTYSVHTWITVSALAAVASVWPNFPDQDKAGPTAKSEPAAQARGVDPAPLDPVASAPVPAATARGPVSQP